MITLIVLDITIIISLPISICLLSSFILLSFNVLQSFQLCPWRKERYKEVKKFPQPLNLWGGSQGSSEWHDSRWSRGQTGRQSVSLQDQGAHWADLWLQASGCCNNRMDSHWEPARSQDGKVERAREKKQDEKKKKTKTLVQVQFNVKNNKLI